MPELDFFTLHYQALRPGLTPMRWMIRMFRRLIEGNPPSLVDLLTGAGKTELVVIWLIALAWHAQNRRISKPVPRRLVWVVNRRVLVQQVYDVAEKLDKALKAPSGPTVELAGQLRDLCKASGDTVFNVVQLRGQRLDDREWSLDPTMPQLIIGTVDQIGSRLLFQGYGLGKWSRPMHAGLFGVDAWVCVDEAHLVPACAVTLRQVREMACRPTASTVPAPIAKFFDQLPFWITELSATPGLPPPKHHTVFPEKNEDIYDDIIADRLLAKTTRRVLWKPQPEKKYIARDLAAEALETAKACPGSAIAIFCRKVEDANAVAKTLSSKHLGRVLLITGRVRGYERDRMSIAGGLFDRFRQDHSKAPVADATPAFLVGTAAAEVGLDADASAIVCDFASLLTLIQRLGRLDRRGQLSKRAKETNTPPPKMIIMGGSNGKTTEAQLKALADKLGSAHPATDSEYGAEFFVGAPWSIVVGKEKGDFDDDEAPTDGAEKEKAGAKPGVEDAVASATWHVLALSSKAAPATATDEASAKQTNEPAGNITASEATPETTLPLLSPSVETAVEATQPAVWLTNPLAGITAGPVVVPPLTDAVLQRWAATTPRPSKFLPVHPWLYGLLPDDEGTPLVGIAFRLELDILQHCRQPDEDDGEVDHTWEKVSKCLTAFPPLNSELHFVPLTKAREWLETLPEQYQTAMAHFDGEEWMDSIEANELTSNSVLVLPTSTTPSALDHAEFLLKSGTEPETQRCWDVFEALAKDGAKYRRELTSSSPRLNPSPTSEKGVYRVPDSAIEDELPEPADTVQTESAEQPEASLDAAKWKPAGIKLTFAKDGISFELRYFKPRRGDGTALDLLPDHLTTAASRGQQLAQALAPDNKHLAALLPRTAKDHDIGKDHMKWQQAMGNTPFWRKENRERLSEHLEAKGRGKESSDAVLVAKPVIENASHAGGYRHEWGTLWSVKDDTNPVLAGADPTTAGFLRDLYLHGIAAHHGYFRPSMPDRGFDAMKPGQQNQLRLDAIERASRLQRQLGYWRLAYLESLIKIADVAASRDAETLENDEQS